MAKITINGKEVTMENLTKDEIIYRNFSGIGGEYNTEGKRNFNVVIRDEDVADELRNLGFRIKPKKNEEGAYTLKIHVNFSSKFPPDVTYILGNKKISVDEENAYLLDKKIPECVDLRFIGYKGKKSRDNFLDAYLDVLFFEAKRDLLYEKHADIIEDEDDENPFE